MHSLSHERETRQPWTLSQKTPSPAQSHPSHYRLGQPNCIGNNEIVISRWLKYVGQDTLWDLAICATCLDAMMYLTKIPLMNLCSRKRRASPGTFTESIFSQDRSFWTLSASSTEWTQGNSGSLYRRCGLTAHIWYSRCQLQSANSLSTTRLLSYSLRRSTMILCRRLSNSRHSLPHYVSYSSCAQILL